jgi:16S rRNA (cytosine967-C5)-methyltransferase
MTRPGMLASQTRAAIQALLAVREAVLGRHQPADRELAAFFRAHREYGSRDRRVIGDLVHDYWRWYGWVESVRPPDGEDPASGAWCRLLLAAGAASASAPEALWRLWALEAAAPDEALVAAWHLEAPADRVRGVLSALGVDADVLEVGHLLPDWAAAEIDSPRPLPELIAWLQQRAPLWLRVQRGRPEDLVAELRAAGVAAAPHPRLPGALSLGSARVSLPTLPAHEDGRLVVQDLASQAIVAACAARPGERWLDACAGAGGKTLALAATVGTGGRIRACDVRAAALEELARRAARAGAANIDIAPAGDDVTPEHAEFDGVLVDAPCSGSGTWRRSPWSRWQSQPSELATLADVQQQLLARAADRVRPGGALVYATCSLFTRENAAVVTRFLETHTEFAPEPFAHPLTGATAPGLLPLWPWDGDNDAMFVARLRRR